MATRFYSNDPRPICWKELVPTSSFYALLSRVRGAKEIAVLEIGSMKTRPLLQTGSVAAVLSPHCLSRALTASCLFKMRNRDRSAQDCL